MKPHKYVIKLSDEERRTLRNLIRSGKTESRLTERTKIVLWADEDLTIDESAYRLDCHRETILYWRQRFLERRWAGIPECLRDLPRSGRPASFSPSAGRTSQSRRL